MIKDLFRYAFENLKNVFNIPKVGLIKRKQKHPFGKIKNTKNKKTTFESQKISK
jgi:hypothetical protein